MEEPTDFQDWELLLNSETGLAVSSPVSSDASRGFEGIEGEDDGAIKSDYFAIDSERRYARVAVSDEESLADSDNPSWVDPNSDSRYLGQPRGELGFAGIGFSRKDSGEFWTSDESSDGQKSPFVHEIGELGSGESSKLKVGFGDKNSVEIWSDSGGIDREDEIGGIGDTVGVEAKRENSNELGSGDPLKRDGLETSEERSTRDSNLENLSVGEGEKPGMVWWKLPLELLKFCAFRVRPVWSISIAAALMGVFMLGRRLYKMKRRSRSIPLKISLDDKKVSQFMGKAARLNEAFQVVRRVPIIRPSMPTTGSAAWPVMALR